MITLATRRTVKFLDLTKVRYPVGAVASFAHRVSGVLLVFALPLLALALDRSLRSDADYAALLDMLRSPWARAVGVVLAWAVAHHVLAGIRHLLTDIGVGSRLAAARRSAALVLAGGVVVAIVAALAWFA